MNLGEWLWAMFVFFLLFQVIFIFIRIFADIFHRRDLSGAAKAVSEGFLLQADADKLIAQAAASNVLAPQATARNEAGR